jgi:gliding motility-associated-like protein
MTKQLPVFLSIIFSMLCINLNAQLCDTLTPTFNVDLRGNSAAIWQSPSIPRAGYCCGASGSDRCVEFVLLLDSAASGIRFDIISGAVPPGALFYQVGCGAIFPVGQNICLTGPGPHRITFCKPGGNNNEFQITSIPKPKLAGDPLISQTCNGKLSVIGLDSSSITWSSVPFNPVFNSYLSCSVGCTTVTVTPTGNFPAFVDYNVCGNVTGGCQQAFFCDTIRVYFFSNLTVSISPQNPVICYGDFSTQLSANGSGGVPPYKYFWNSGHITQTINVGPGTYKVIIMDSTGCYLASDSVTINQILTPTTANAGPDQNLCSPPNQVQLNGTVLGASGGVWTGGTGQFSPSNSSLNALYIPTQTELLNGITTLILSTTTSNNNCPVGNDTVNIMWNAKPEPQISGVTTVCEFQTTFYSVIGISGHSYLWNVSGGSIQGSNTNSGVSVSWGTQGTGIITVSQTSPQGCDSTVSIAVTINPSPTQMVGGPASVCLNDTAVYYLTHTAGNSYQWFVSGGAMTTGNGSSSIGVTWPMNVAGAVMVTITNSYGCSSTSGSAVTINNYPPAGISGNTDVCENSQDTYSTSAAAGYIYTWSVSGGIINGPSNSHTVNVSWGSAGTGSVTVNVTNASGCKIAETRNINIHSSPTVSMFGPAFLCQFESGNFTASFATNTLYTWSGAGATFTGGNSGQNVTVSWNTPGKYFLVLSTINSFGCEYKDSLVVNINPNPQPVISGDVLVCSNRLQTYTITPQSGHSYFWSVTGGIITSSNTGVNVTVNWQSSGNLSVVQTSDLGCEGYSNINVTVNPSPVAEIYGQDIVCSYKPYTYYASSGASNNHVWSVIGGTIIGSNNNTILQVNWGTAGYGSVTMKQTTQAGCDTTVTLDITISPTPEPVITGPVSICEGRTVTYDATYAWLHTYNWTISGGVIDSFPSVNSVVVTWNGSGTGYLTVTMVSPRGCDSTVTIQVQINGLPATSITGPGDACEQSLRTYSVNGPPTNTYNWNVTGGSIVGFSIGNSIDVIWGNAGTGTVRVAQINNSGCDSSHAISVNINAIPSPQIFGNQTSCEKETHSFTVPQDPGSTFTWSVPGGSVIPLSQNTIMVTWSTPGNHTVSVQQVTTGGCVATSTFNVEVFPKPKPAISGSINACTGSGNIIYTASSGLTGGNAVNYNWTVSGGVIISGNGTNQLTVNWNQAGQGMISVSVEDSVTGCEESVGKNVNITVPIVPVIQASVISGCVPLKVAFTGNTVATGVVYTWNFGNGAMSNLANQSFTYNQPGTYQVSVTATTSSGCTETTTSTITVYPKPVADFTHEFTNKVYYVGEDILKLTNLSSGATTYLWEFGNGMRDVTQNPQFLYTVPGIYMITLTVTNSNGCQDVVKKEIVVKMRETIYIPNAFTPNGDSNNDMFSVKHENLVKLNISIFNRWGEIIYTSDKVDFAWDGNYQGNPVHDGVYGYVLRAEGYHGEKFNENGKVTLLR